MATTVCDGVCTLICCTHNFTLAHCRVAWCARARIGSSGMKMRKVRVCSAHVITLHISLSPLMFHPSSSAPSLLFFTFNLTGLRYLTSYRATSRQPWPLIILLKDSDYISPTPTLSGTRIPIRATPLLGWQSCSLDETAHRSRRTRPSEKTFCSRWRSGTHKRRIGMFRHSHLWDSSRTRKSNITAASGESMGWSGSKRKDELVWKICDEEGTLSRKSQKNSPRNWRITMKLLRRDKSSQTIENWLIVFATWEGSCYCESIITQIRDFQNKANSLSDEKE